MAMTDAARPDWHSAPSTCRLLQHNVVGGGWALQMPLRPAATHRMQHFQGQPFAFCNSRPCIEFFAEVPSEAAAPPVTGAQACLSTTTPCVPYHGSACARGMGGRCKEVNKIGRVMCLEITLGIADDG
uniref:Uncharacterized protein n=1 Tax=Eutreptiella gymnastica TaxID=73025 RepID=A0A7S4FY87_9EUGL